jgi:hypothetical protein
VGVSADAKLLALRDAARNMVVGFDLALAKAKHVDELGGLADVLYRLRMEAWTHYHIGGEPLCMTLERRPSGPLRALGVDCPDCLSKDLGSVA